MHISSSTRNSPLCPLCSETLPGPWSAQETPPVWSLLCGRFQGPFFVLPECLGTLPCLSGLLLGVGNLQLNLTSSLFPTKWDSGQQRRRKGKQCLETWWLFSPDSGSKSSCFPFYELCALIDDDLLLMTASSGTE